MAQIVERKGLFTRIRDWIDDHPEEVSVITGVAIGVCAGVGSAISKQRKRLIKEEKRNNTYIYDPQNNITWKTKKRNNNINLIIATRRANGEPLYKILTDMNLLK